MKAKAQARLLHAALTRRTAGEGEAGERQGEGKARAKAALPSGFSGGAGKAEQWKGESALGKSGRSCALGKSEIRRFQKKS